MLTEDFDLPSRQVDKTRWEDPFKDCAVVFGENGPARSRSRSADRRDRQVARSDCGDAERTALLGNPDLPVEDWSLDLS